MSVFPAYRLHYLPLSQDSNERSGIAENNRQRIFREKIMFKEESAGQDQDPEQHRHQQPRPVLHILKRTDDLGKPDKTRDGSLSCRIVNAPKTENRPLS